MLYEVITYLSQRMEAVSRSRIQSAADAGNILVNGDPVKSSYKVKPGDIVTIRNNFV